MMVKESDQSDSTYNEKYYIDFADLNVASWDTMIVEERTRTSPYVSLLGLGGKECSVGVHSVSTGCP